MLRSMSVNPADIVPSGRTANAIFGLQAWQVVVLEPDAQLFGGLDDRPEVRTCHPAAVTRLVPG